VEGFALGQAQRETPNEEIRKKPKQRDDNTREAEKKAAGNKPIYSNNLAPHSADERDTGSGAMEKKRIHASRLRGSSRAGINRRFDVLWLTKHPETR